MIEEKEKNISPSAEPMMTSTGTDSRAASSNYGLVTTLGSVPKNFVTEGDVPCLVILVQFSDVKFSYSQNVIEQWLNSETPSPQWEGWEGGSVRSYFIKQSRGKFRPHFDVYGTYTSNRTASQCKSNPTGLVVEALQSFSSGIDLKKYDVNGDGAVDNVYMIYAGSGGHLDGGATIWPANATTEASMQGLRVRHVSYANELDNGFLQGIGTFVHEFGHVIGLADLYTTAGNYPSSYTNYWTPTYWDVMDTGCDLYYGYYPPNMSAYELHALKWSEPYEINKREYLYLSSLQDDGRSVMLRNPENQNEVYYFEYRDQKGWDSYHSGNGLLIWHVNYDQQSWNSGSVNNSSTNPLVKIVAADGRSGSSASYNTIYYKTDEYLAGDPFPGTTGKTEFRGTTEPAFLKADGTGFILADGITVPDISSISEKTLGGKKYMTFSVSGAADREVSHNIVGTDSMASAIETVDADSELSFDVLCEGLTMTVKGADEGQITAYDVTGREVARAKVNADGTATITVPSRGIYILRAGAVSVKTVIR